MPYDKIPDLTGEEAERGEASRQAVSAVGAAPKDEFLDFIADFTQEAAKNLDPLLRGSVRFTARASIIGAMIETLLDLANSGRVATVRELFKVDEQRRVFLHSVSWGDYQPPQPMRPQTAPRYAPNLGRGPV